MAKRKRLTPARNIDPSETEIKASSNRPPIASGTRAPIADIAHDAASSAAFDAVAQELADARETGRLIQKLPLEAISADYITRDRMSENLDRDALLTLVDSLRSRGQQNAIEVADLGQGRYGLISGWRRLHALRLIAGEDPSHDTILAIIRQPADMADAYQAMVDENEIRADLSFYERARIVTRSVEQGVYRNDKAALTALFGTVPRAKRSKISSFTAIVRACDTDLQHPTQISEKIGLAMAAALKDDPHFAARLKSYLGDTTDPSAAQELKAIKDALAMMQAIKSKSTARHDNPDRIYISDDLTMTRLSDGKVTLEGTALGDKDYFEYVCTVLRNIPKVDK